MKVTRPSVKRIRRRRLSPKKNKVVAGVDFRDKLRSSIKEELDRKLKHLLKDIDREGKKLIAQRTMDNLRKYKQMVKDFLNTVVKNAYHLREHINFSLRGTQNILVVIENIDRSLEDLTRMVLNKECDNLKLLEKIGEIRGLLIDIYS